MNPSVGSGLQTATTPGSTAAFAWSLGGLILLLTSLQLPFVAAAKFGQYNEGRMFSGFLSLWQQGHWPLALVVASCGFLVPLLLLGGMLLAASRGEAPPPVLRRLEPWSMPDVRLLAILVAFVKLSALVEARPAAGLWCYGAAAVCAIAASRALAVGSPAPATAPSRDGLTVATACGLGALCLLVPAYLLPVMSFERIGQAHADTIFSSVLKLWHTGLWALALIVFTASLLVPVLKLAGLAVLLAGLRRPGRIDPTTLHRLYHLVHGVGRWSMLDVFLVAFLAGIVNFGGLARIEARPGVLAFAGAVLLTMLATAALAGHRPSDRQTTPIPPL